MRALQLNFVVACCALAVAGSAFAAGTMLPVGPGVFVMKDRMEVEFARGVPVGPVAVVDGVVQAGVPSFDRLCRTYRGVSLEPMFPKADPDYAVDLSRFYVLTFAGDLPNILAAVDAFRAVADLEEASPCYVHEVDYIPNDPDFGLQWNLKHVDDHDVDADEAWDINHGSAAYACAIADTGVDWEHPDLAANIWYNEPEKNGTLGVDDDGNGYVDDDKGWDFVTGVSGTAGEDLNVPDNDPMDFNGHGTHVSGIASAATDNTTGVAGVGFNSKIMCLRIGWDSGGNGYVMMNFAASALYYAANKGAVSFNASWGSTNSGGLGAALDYALSMGVLVCSAAGNSNNQNPSYLCSRSEVIAVASTTVFGTKSDFSNYGYWVDVCAPGSSIYSTYRHAYGDHTYWSMSGTSMSCPHVVGEAALVKTKYPTWGWSEISSRIISSCDNIDGLNPGYEGLLGAGIINCRRALSDTGVELTSFTARGADDAVAVRWTTGREYDHAGFNLYRRIKGENAARYAKLNGNLIRGRSPYLFTDGDVAAGTAYEYLLEEVDLAGGATKYGPVVCRYVGKALPAAFTLSRPWPNPAPARANITYALPAGFTGTVEVALYDLSGRRVATLASGPAVPGDYRVSVDTSALAPGVYLCRLTAGSAAATTKLVVAH